MHFKMLSAICFNLDQSVILSSGIELKQSNHIIIVIIIIMIIILLYYEFGEELRSMMSWLKD